MNKSSCIVNNSYKNAPRPYPYSDLVVAFACLMILRAMLAVA